MPPVKVASPALAIAVLLPLLVEVIVAPLSMVILPLIVPLLLEIPAVPPLI